VLGLVSNQAAARRVHLHAVNAILLSFLISLAVNAAFFAVAAIRRTDVVTDLSYSLSFALLAIVLPSLGAREPVQLAASLLVLIWAARLGGYLLTRILRIKVDHRFDGMRDDPLRFARFWLLQAISVAVIMLPVSYLLSRDDAPGLGLWAIAGVSIWLVGLVIEAAADAQKSAFKAKEENRERFITSGLWSYSRHPNYFGEMLVWWGLFIYAVPFLQGAAFAVVIGPVFITLLLLFVSGIPLLEKSAEAKYGDDPAYLEYRRRTSILVPLPPRS
jgi:steroid 5-alpha reductase family enzyme